METNLRPMTLGEILDRTAQLYRTNFLLFGGISSAYAGVLLALGLAQTALQEWMQTARLYRALVIMSGMWVLLTWIAVFICGGIAIAAISRAVAWLHLGEAATIRGAYQDILPKLGRYLWLGFLKVVFAWTPVIVIYAGFIGVLIYLRVKGLLPRPGTVPHISPEQGPALIGLVVAIAVLGIGLVPAMAYGVLMELRYALAVPACVVEELKARAAIRRSIELSKLSRGRIFVLWMLVGVIALGLTLVSQGFFIIFAVRNHQQLPVWMRILQQVVGFCTTTFVTPILATGLMLFYYDQRVRKEGYDIERMMQAAGMNVPAPPLIAQEGGGQAGEQAT
jgi:hypothetical protein